MDNTLEVTHGRRMAVFGDQGSGKSTFARGLFLAEYVQHYTRSNLFVLDINPTHFTGNEIVPGLNKHGFHRIDVNDFVLEDAMTQEGKPGMPLADYISGLDFHGLLLEARRAVLVIELAGQELDAAANSIARAIKRMGDAALLVDECTNFLPQGQNNATDFTRLLTAGRNRGVDWIVVTQHANFANRTFKQAPNWFISSQTTHELDLKHLRNGFGDWTELIPKLNRDRREFLARSKDEPVPYLIDPHQLFSTIQ